MFGFALTASGIAVTEAQIQDINGRLSAMSRQIDFIEKTQRDLSSNIEYLKENSDFLGFETNLLANYINQLKEFYSCDMMTGFFELYLSSFDRRLDGVFQNLLSRQLSESLIERKVLREITKDMFFYDMTFCMN